MVMRIMAKIIYEYMIDEIRLIYSDSSRVDSPCSFDLTSAHKFCLWFADA